MKEQQESSQDTLEAVEKDSELIVFNDEVNTFNHVINTLIRVCKHSNEQAQQCTLIIHFKR
jgi:ATP-dependent Clp protease adaptor protein ClpS